MLDLLFNPQKAERHPLEIVIIGIFYSSLSILLGLWVFKSQASLAIIFLTTLSCVYVVQGAIKMEEKKEKNYEQETWLLKQHKPIIILILALFIGFTISATLWTLFLPAKTSAIVFELQATSIYQIQSITGNAIYPENPLIQIIKNNLNIILVSTIIALFFGAGAIYILAWNASVMGFAIGSIARESFGLLALPITFTKYFLHGIPEIIAYIIASIAGAILYFAFIKGDLTNKNKNKRILVDVAMLLLISIILIVISAFIEVYISSLI